LHQPTARGIIANSVNTISACSTAATGAASDDRPLSEGKGLSRCGYKLFRPPEERRAKLLGQRAMPELLAKLK